WALQKGVVSERKRVRAAGRAWLNFCRQDFLNKRGHIHLEHVSSHRGLNTPEQVGNDKADQVANFYRSLGEKRAPVHSEKQFTLTHKGRSIQGDIRAYIKRVEREKMTEI